MDWPGMERLCVKQLFDSCILNVSAHALLRQLCAVPAWHSVHVIALNSIYFSVETCLEIIGHLMHRIDHRFATFDHSNNLVLEMVG